MMKKCKDECENWETCGGCPKCRWIMVCNNAFKYLPDPPEEETKKSEE